jgi:hypothetical protein
MFDQIFDSMRKMVEVNVQAQQEMFRRWAALWPGMPGVPGVTGPAVPSFAEQAQRFQKKWTEAIADIVKRQGETTQEQLVAGLKQIEEAFKPAEIKDVETFRARTLELWQNTFALMQQFFGAQVRDFQAAVARWTEVFSPAA